MATSSGGRLHGGARAHRSRRPASGHRFCDGAFPALLSATVVAGQQLLDRVPGFPRGDRDGHEAPRVVRSGLEHCYELGSRSVWPSRQ